MELFNRSGTARIANAGERGHRYTTKCSRCGGAGGSKAWEHTGYTCYQCGGSGLGPTKVEKLYTADELAVLDARLAKARARRQALIDAETARIAAERAAARDAFLAGNTDTLAKLDELAADEVSRAKPDTSLFWDDVRNGIVERAHISERQAEMINTRYAELLARREAESRAREAGHLGQPGQRVKTRACVVECRHIGIVSRYPLIHRFLVRLETEQGHTLVWWTGCGKYTHDDFVECALTVKEHGAFNGKPQTTVQRVTFKD
jgi:hypothetical protein